MRVRADSVFISSVLHTIALLFFVRAALWNYFAGSNQALFAKLDAGFQAASETAHYLGVSCLAVIVIGLIIVWTGYVKRSRSAWLVMFVIVWFWAFPIFILPFLTGVIRGRLVLSLTETLYYAMSESSGLRLELEAELMFLLMVIALFLPIKKFFVLRSLEEPIHWPSAGLVGLCLTSVLIVLAALYTWIRVGVVYEIPVMTLNLTDRLPPPPAPPNHNSPVSDSR
jgi:hypothetical protein